MALNLPRLKANLAIVNGRGQPLDYFLRFWNIEVAPRIERQESSQDALIQGVVALQEQQAAQLALIQQALELAGLAVGYSGSSTEPDFTFTSLGVWQNGPIVNLTAVPVASDLTVPGTGLQVDSNTSFSSPPDNNATGRIRIVEVVSGVDTTVMTFDWSARGVFFNGSTYITVTNDPDITTATYASSETGDVSYRLDAIQDSGDLLTNVGVFLFVRRAST